MTYEGSQFDAAVKTLLSTQDAGDKLKLLKEAAIMGQFQHPHVVRLYGMVESEEMVRLPSISYTLCAVHHDMCTLYSETQYIQF